MNRQQRRAAQFKRGQRHDRNLQDRHFDSVLSHAAWSRVYDPEKAAELMNRALLAWYKLTNGHGQPSDFDMLAEMANTAQAVVLDGHADEFVIETFERGIESLNDMRSRWQRTGLFGADAKSLQAVPDLLGAMGIVFANITPLQAASALRRSMSAHSTTWSHTHD